jgi:Ca-activated chloride channel family protein
VPPDQRTLQEIANDTGGKYQAAESAQSLQTVYANIGSQIGYTTVHKDISWRFLVIGLLFAMSAAATSMLWAGRIT